MSNWVLIEDLCKNYINLDRVNYIQHTGEKVFIFFSGQENLLELNVDKASQLMAEMTVLSGK